MKTKTASLLILLFGGLTFSSWGQVVQTHEPTIAAQTETAFDQADPSSVVLRLFDAAITNDPQMLMGLCDPQRENDGDTDCICALAAEYVPHKCPEDSRNRIPWEDYKQIFEHAKLAGEATIEGEGAMVPFLFGPEGSRPETMVLVKRGEKWYLLSF